MFQCILVPLDGSVRAERAIPFAARVARASGGTVVLVRVVSHPREFLPCRAPPLPSACAQTFLEIERDEATRYLIKCARARELVDVKTVPLALEGSAAESILSVAHEQHCDLIIMCCHGYTGNSRWVLGSVADKIAHHASMPVLILHEESPVLTNYSPDVGRSLRVLVPLDGSPQAEVALLQAAQLVAALANPAQCVFHLMMVIKLPSADDEQHHRVYTHASMQAYLGHEATAYLTMLVDRLRTGTVTGHSHEIPLHLTITWSIAFATDVAETLLKAAEHEETVRGDTGDSPGYDLIAIGARGRGGTPQWQLGNVAERMIQASKLPLLIVR